MENDDPVYSRKVLEMITVAHEFCLFMEKSDDYPEKQIYSYLQKVLPLLYIKGSLLPDVTPEHEEFAERFVTEEEWENLFLILSKKFSTNDSFDIIPDDKIKAEGYERISLSECLADIYQDMKDFVILYQKSSHAAKENAVFQCAELFKSRWGRSITHCLNPIHKLNYSNIVSSGADFENIL